MKKSTGFTLIELLVVVLIIGILAAIAVPQYTLAVNKTRFANLRSMAKPYLQAMRAYHLANGEWPSDMDELSIESPAGMRRTNRLSENYSCASNDTVFCCMQGNKKDTWATGIICGSMDYSVVYINLLDNATVVSLDTDVCGAKSTDDNANKLCKALSGTSHVYAGGISTPAGRRATYNYYIVKQ